MTYSMLQILIVGIISVSLALFEQKSHNLRLIEAVGPTIASFTFIAFACVISSRGIRSAARVNKIIGYIFLLYSLSLTALVIYTGIRRLVDGQWWYRVELLGVNPNLVAASLVLGGVIAIQFSRPNRIIGFSWILFIFAALLLTGSRTGLIAFSAAIVLMLQVPFRKRLALVGLVLIIGTVPVFLESHSNVQSDNELYGNLLHYSNRLEHASWRKDFAAELVLRRYIAHSDLRTVFGTDPPYTIYEITGSSAPSSGLLDMLFYQSTGESLVDQPYVASAYFRSTTSAQLLLSSNLATVTCSLGPKWQRCESPPAVGDGRIEAQFQVRTVEPGRRINFEMYGAQLEVGSSATAVAETGATAISWLFQESTLGRLWQLQQAAESGKIRSAIYSSAWRAFLSAPLLGHGPDFFPLTLSAETMNPVVMHGHNLLLHVLATRGLIGLCVLLIPIGVLLTLKPSNAIALFPMLSAVSILNTFDYVYYFAGVFYPFWAGSLLILLKTMTFQPTDNCGVSLKGW